LVSYIDLTTLPIQFTYASAVVTANTVTFMSNVNGMIQEYDITNPLFPYPSKTYANYFGGNQTLWAFTNLYSGNGLTNNFYVNC
jgi:hypothetical protein